MCGYCKDDPCSCNGFGGPKGLSRHEAEAACGYCKGKLYEARPSPAKKGEFVAHSVECGCDGFGGPLR